MVGHGEDQLPDARPRHRASPPRRAERLGAINIVLASGRIGQPKLRLRHDHRPGATARAAASTARSATSSPAGATSPTPSIARYIAGVWGIDEPRSARPGVDAYEIFRKIDARRDQGAARRSASTRRCRCRTTTSSTALLEKLEFFVAIDFFLNETARHADIVLPGCLQEEDEGTVTQVEGPGHQDQQGRRLPRRGARRTGASSRTSRSALGRAARVHVRRARARSSRSCASPARAASPTTPASPTRRSSSRSASSGRATATDPRTARRSTIPARRGCSSRVARTRSRRAPGRSTSPTARPASTSPTTRRRPKTSTTSIRSILTTGRVVSQFLSGTQTRRIGPLVDQYPEPRIEMHPRLAAKLGHRRRRLGDGRDAARRRSRCGRRW